MALIWGNSKSSGVLSWGPAAAAAPAPTGVITSVVVSGQRVTISGTTGNSPSAVTGFLSPASPANGAVAQGPTNGTLGAGTFTVVLNGVPPGSYLAPAVNLSSAGGIANILGSSGIEILGISGSATAPDVAVAPSITTQPQPQNVTEGATATFSVVATGTAPLSYQWRKNGSAISGAVSASYTTPATALNDSGAVFAVVVSNAGGSITSAGASLTVQSAAQPPVITGQPSPQTVPEGGAVVFNVFYTGADPVSIQWRRNGQNVGPDAATYVFNASMADDGVLYSVVITNSIGSATSDSAMLTVTPLPSSLIVEDGTGKEDAESYISVSEATAYHTKRNNSEWLSMSTAEKEAALRKATDYMVQVYRWRWAGVRVSNKQYLDWPRANVPIKDITNTIDQWAYYETDKVPKEVRFACAELALKAKSSSLAPDVSRLTTREKVEGIEVEYSSSASPWVRYRSADNMLTPYLSEAGGAGITVARS